MPRQPLAKIRPGIYETGVGPYVADLDVDVIFWRREKDKWSGEWQERQVPASWWPGRNIRPMLSIDVYIDWYYHQVIENDWDEERELLTAIGEELGLDPRKLSFGHGWMPSKCGWVRAVDYSGKFEPIIEA
jgi:hypothetical protein